MNEYPAKNKNQGCRIEEPMICLQVYASWWESLGQLPQKSPTQQTFEGEDDMIGGPNMSNEYLSLNCLFLEI